MWDNDYRIISIAGRYLKGHSALVGRKDKLAVMIDRLSLPPPTLHNIRPLNYYARLYSRLMWEYTVVINTSNCYKFINVYWA